MNNEMKNLKLEYHETYIEDGELYLSIEYSYYDKENNRHALVIPKITLPIFENSKPIIDGQVGVTYEDCFIRIFAKGLHIDSVYQVKFHNEKGVLQDYLYFQDKTNYVDVITDYATKKMTMSEIEEKLGYKIELVREDGDK